MQRALLILDLQNEFLSPSTGRCLLPDTTDDLTKQPAFLTNIRSLLSRFRSLGGDVIFMRSEYRDLREPSDETILIIHPSDEDDLGSESSSDEGAGGSGSGASMPRPPKIKASSFSQTITKEISGTVLSTGRPPLLTDAYLSISTSHPPCSPGTTAAAWFPFVTPLIQPQDRTFTKSYYSAFRETPLLQTLRGRIVTQLVIVGLLTNIDVLATAADAVRHGLEVWVVEDCLGYRSETAHLEALEIMESELAVEKCLSGVLLRGWEKERRRLQAAAAAGQKEPKEKQPETQNSEVNGTEKAEEKKVQLEEQTKTKSVDTHESVSQKPEGTETKESEPNESAESPRPTSSSGTSKKERKPRKYESSAPVMTEGDSVGEGDSYIKYNILPPDQSSTAFENIKNEVQWRSMFHRGGEVPRLVAVEGEVREDGSFPIYRHPADESPPLLPFSPTINSIRLAVQKHLQHPLNHVLIQHYRDGNDYISEHSDKTLDIAKGSKIVNVSLGAQRTMVLRQKKDTSPAAMVAAEKQETRPMQRIPLPHNSIFCLGLETNQKWMHAIKADKREPKIKAPEELAYGGERISLTFRHIATYLSADEKHIYGQGAVSKTAEDMRETQNGPSEEAEKLLAAFGAENQQSDFDWNHHYGKGFDVLNFQIPKPKLLISSSSLLTPDIPTTRIKLCLAIKHVDFQEQIVEQNTTGLRTYNPRGTAPVFIDTDRERTILTDSLAILQYLEMFYPAEPWLLPSPVEERAAYANALQRLQDREMEMVGKELRIWEAWLGRGRFAAGAELGLVDVAIWPVLEAVERGGVELPGKVCAYWRRLREMEEVRCVYESKKEMITDGAGKKDGEKDDEVEELARKVEETRIDS
ncbi:hypothetical protein BZA77DRAFT_331599 [Pyronema omphalodes]|nr:hypothetical protein BZA77DRAFT_331599 [Pyronema omphalodes]